MTGALSRAAGENVGSYAILQGSLAASSNYTLGYVGANFTINPMTLTVTATAGQSKTYGDSDPASLAYTITTGHLVGGDALTGALSRNPGENAGSYAITQGSLVASSNYTLGYVGANFTINPMALVATASSGQSKVYGDTDPASFAYALTTGHLVGGDTLTGALTRNAGENVGSYAVLQGSLAASSNYTLGYVGANFTINPMALVATASSGQSKVYGDADPTFAYTLTTGHLVGSDALTGALARAAGENAGSYAITQGSLAASSNYTLGYIGANFTINPMALTVTASSGQSKISGDADPTFAYAITSGHLVGGDTLTGALSRNPGENAGSYAITQGSLAASSNYTLGYIGANFTINPMALVATASSGQSKTYGDADPGAFAYTLTTGHLVGSDTLTGALSRNPGENAGSYAITQGSLAASGNYTLGYVGANFSVTQRPITVTALGETKVYGNADPALAYAVTSGNLVRGDGLAGALTRSAGENVGSYAITQGSLAASSNYLLAFAPGNLAITPAALAITAGNAAKTYGDTADLSGTVFTASGLVSGDRLTSVSFASSGAPATANAGTYAIIASGAAGTGLGNYTITYTPGTLTVAARALAITANNASRVYGAANPAFTASVSGLVNGDSVSGAPATAATAASHTGSYAIVQGSLAASANYAIAFTGGTLTITPPP